MITPLHSSNCPRGNFCSCCRDFRRKPSRKAFLGSGVCGDVQRKSEWLKQFRWQVALRSELRCAYFMVQKVWHIVFFVFILWKYLLEAQNSTNSWLTQTHKVLGQKSSTCQGCVKNMEKSLHQEIKPNQVHHRKARKQKGKEKLKGNKKKGKLKDHGRRKCVLTRNNTN